MRTAIRRSGMAMRVEMDLFAFICHSDPTKVRIEERKPAETDVKLLKLTEGSLVTLDPPVSAASGDSRDSIDKLFDDRNDDVLEETIAKDVSKVAAKKTKKKRKRKVAEDARGSTFPPRRIREDHHAAASHTGGKSLVAICNLVLEGSSVPSGVTEPPTIVSVPPTPDDRPIDFVSRLNLRTYPPSLRYVVSLDDSHHSGSCSEVKSLARSPVADTLVTTVAITTTIIADAFAVLPPWVRVVSKNLEIFGDSASAGGANADAAGTSKLNEPANSSDFFYASQDLDSETLHRIYLRAMDYDKIYIEFNVGAARQVFLGTKRDTEIAHLKSLLSLKEAEAAEAIRLRGQLSMVEATDAAKSTKLRDLKERNFALEGEKDVLSEKVATLESVTTSKETELASLTAQVAFLESEKDRLADQNFLLESAFELFKGCMEAMQDEQAMILGNRVAELDAQLLEMAAHLDEELYPCFLTAISRRQWILTHMLKLVLLKYFQSPEYCHALGHAIGCAVNKGIQDGLRAGVDHGKVGRDLSVIEAYDPSAEAKYIDAVNALGTIDFSMLSELKSKKYQSIVDLMDYLCLEGPLAEIPRVEDLQPSLAQLMLPIHMPEDDVVLGEISLSFSLQAMVPLAEPLSSKSLTGEASTFAAHATSKPITILSMTFASSNVVLPLSISNDQVLDTEPHDEDPLVMTFEKQELNTSPE
ncbi:hypothetical protein Tco_0385819 [Tanacetum coccineum]